MTVNAPEGIDDTPVSHRSRSLVTAAVTGLLAVIVAWLTGTILALALGLMGLTTTGALELGTWLAGAGLLGGWSQSVTATVAGGLEWSTWAAGAPMLVTLAVMGLVAATARRTEAPAAIGAVAAAAGAAAGAVVLVLASQTSLESTNTAGSVTQTAGLTWWWTGGTHPGTLLGSALLVGGTWWINTAALDWWRSGRALARGILIIPGLVLGVVVAGALVYLTSSPAVGLAALLLFPLLGVGVLLSIGGAPSAAGITRLSPEPYDLWTWSGGLMYAVAGLVAVVVLAVVVGLVLRARKHECDWLSGITVTVLTAGFITWATDAAVVVPEALGGQTRLATNPLAAAGVAAVMAVIALAVRGRVTENRPKAPDGDSAPDGD